MVGNLKVGDQIRQTHSRFRNMDHFEAYINSSITHIIHDTIPTYRINYLPGRYNENLLLQTKLSLEENNRNMKKLNLIEKNKT